MLQSEIFIFEFVSINRFTASAIVIGKITTLAHEVGNDSVERTAFVSETFFTGAQSAEVFSSFWYNIAIQL